jgi:hypothetical protein
MSTFININVIAGQSPFDIYLCDNPITTCVYIDTITSLSLPYDFQIPVVLEGQNDFTLKVIDNNECISYKNIIDVTPTPTPTITPTITVTPTITPTPTITETPTNTPTPTTPIFLYPISISLSSHPTDACEYITSPGMYVSNIGGFSGNETITLFSVIYTDSGGTIPFTGNGDYYKIKITGSSIFTSSQVDGSGNVVGIISNCP